MTSLRNILCLNAASCLGFGATFLLTPAAVAQFLGSPPRAVVLAVGIGLLINGLHLAAASSRATVRPVEVLWFSVGDLLWWLASLGLMAAQVWITTPSGTAAAWAVAIAIATLGLAQLWHLGLQRSGLSSKAHLVRIGHSWLAIRPPVKIWLFALNAVFLAGLYFLPTPLGRVPLMAYVASGPLLLAFAAWEGGLSRLTGVGHLIAWVPLLVWLPLHARDAGPEPWATAYGTVLFAACAVCLALDLSDLRRWLRGERQILAKPIPSGEAGRGVSNT